MITAKQIEILRHTVGADSKNPGYRNRYVSDMTDDIQALIDMGLMSGPFFSGEFGGNSMFCVTESGRQLMGIKRLEKLVKANLQLEYQRDSYREFWLSKNTLHSWERNARIAEDQKDLEEAVNGKG